MAPNPNAKSPPTLIPLCWYSMLMGVVPERAVLLVSLKEPLLVMEPLVLTVEVTFGAP